MKTRLLALALLSVFSISFTEALAASTIGPVPVPRSELHTIQSRILGRSYDVYVKLPPGYDKPEARDQRYPVLYLNDAPYMFHVAGGITHLPMGAKQIEELILVGIGYWKGSVGDESRVLDYTPTVNRRSRKHTGGAAGYLDFIEREVVPFVEQTYRANPQRRAYAGHSYGGLFGAYVLLHRPALFCCYILSSPSFWYDQHVTWRLESEYAKRQKDLRARVYVGIGGLEQPRKGPYTGPIYDMVGDVRTFESKLESRKYPGLSIRSFVMPGATHETVFATTLMNGVLWHFTTSRDVPYGY